MQIDEMQLIAHILDGHPDGYGYFLNRYGDNVLGFVSTVIRQLADAEEITEDAFVEAFNILGQYDARKAKFSSWVCRIAYNDAISYLRKRNKQRQLMIDDNWQIDKLNDSIVDEAFAEENEERAKLVEKAILRLNDEEQFLIRQFYYDEMPLSDIAYILNQQAGTLATRLHRIRKKLYVIIKQQER